MTLCVSLVRVIGIRRIHSQQVLTATPISLKLSVSIFPLQKNTNKDLSLPGLTQFTLYFNAVC